MYTVFMFTCLGIAAINNITKPVNSDEPLLKYARRYLGTAVIRTRFIHDGAQDVFINDNNKEEIIRIHHQDYYVFIVKKYIKNTAMLLVLDKQLLEDAHQPASVRHCEEWPLGNDSFTPAAEYLKSDFPLDKNIKGIEIAANPKDIPNIPYNSCDDITKYFLSDKSREKRQALETYGNWCGTWSNPSIESSCCPGCANPTPCISVNCTPQIDKIDEACTRYTFCQKCWQETPNKELPHCDCVRDLTSDLRQARCTGLLLKACYNYRSRLYGFMSNHNCWGRLTLKIVETYQCGFQQESCDAHKCNIKPQMCYKKSIKILNNFKCLSYHTCEETFRRSRSSSG